MSLQFALRGLRSVWPVSGLGAFRAGPAVVRQGPAAPSPLWTTQVAGLKFVPRPTRRCRDCWTEVKDNVTYVHCSTNPRHKQATKPHIPIKVFRRVGVIMTHATQGSSKFGNGRGRCKMWSQHLFRLDY